MIYPMPRNSSEEKELRRQAYECEKKGLIIFHEQQGYDKSTLNIFLVNSLKGYEEFLKEDGLI
ncbi:MAG: hypothetical protein E7269_08625 [Lachnospiraceae bacterium]|nr:hypothetical protein [Lachnospiraceae bacterium]